MAGPTISVVVPAYNAERFISDALASVERQTYPWVECLVVDDGSTDGTAELVRHSFPRCQLVQQDNRGVSAARNAGATLARGDLLAFLDSDDVWLPERSARLADAMLVSHAEFAVCGVQDTDEDLAPTGRPRHLRSDHPLTEGLLIFDGRTEMVSVSSAALFTKEFFLELGGFSESLSTSADRELLIRAAEQGCMCAIEDPLVLYRRHSRSMSSDLPRMERDLYAVLQMHAARILKGEERSARSSLSWMLASSYLSLGQRASAARLFGRALRESPLMSIRCAAASAQRRIHRP